MVVPCRVQKMQKVSRAPQLDGYSSESVCFFAFFVREWRFFSLLVYNRPKPTKLLLFLCVRSEPRFCLCRFLCFVALYIHSHPKACGLRLPHLQSGAVQLPHLLPQVILRLLLLEFRERRPARTAFTWSASPCCTPRWSQRGSPGESHP